MKPIRISCVLVEALTYQQLEFLLFKLLKLADVIRQHFLTILDHVKFKIVHLQLEIKIFYCMLMTVHLDASVICISRCFNLQVEGVLDTRMLPVPLEVRHISAWNGRCILG